MQFIPTFSSQASSWSLFDTAGFTSVDYGSDSDFNDIMQDALDEEEERKAREASQATTSNPLLTGPYNPKVSSNGVTFTLEEVCFTKTELAELREQLLKEGAPEDALANFDLLAGRPDGATLGQVLASLQLNGKPSLTDDDISSLTGLLNQLDPSGTLTDQTLDLMRNGHSQQALIGINQALMQLDATSEITLSQGDLQTLGKALNLPESVLGKMKSLFGSADELTLNKEQMSALLAPAQDYLGQLALKQQKLDDAAEATVKQVIGKARERMKKEREAASLQSREVEQSKTMIKETVQENSHGTLTEALQQSGDAKLNEALSKNAQGTDLPDGFEHIGKQGQGDPQQFAGGNQDGRGRNTPDGGKNDGWSSLLSKVKADTGSGLTGNAYRTDGVMGTAFATLHQLAGQQQMPNSARAEVGPYLSQQAAQQVQNGLLSALRNGGTRLDLQLNPVELGSIAITLSSRNGEVTAQIRTEKTETMQAMQQQAEAIRLQLEQQGVKIDKIEVQLQNQGNNQQADSGWQNMQQHNTWAEQDARREELSRLRNLAMVRNSAGNQENTDLAHSMQDTEQTAIYATRRLNVVA
ncbi:flagellar hook-length control protein FliK [uncultured Desulfovibrio sp.]|uniref:flagellar hook-length control protein FliK n=1 Tax=uncultured Desulfovibrio sp. TaxID=167968 RepID=UPI002639D2BA|nr:flagellar hook-length control protein FliK [uncultured Desulfovibrio sp.]